MLKFPNAKINLGLRILDKRPDGFHNIESVFYPVNYCDALEIIPSDKFSFESNGTNLPGDSWDNLCVKAYDLLRVDFDLPPVKIFLFKQIAIGAGLGGGSADAAFTLKMLNAIFKLELTGLQLEKYAVQLGSDCVFFVKNKPAVVTSRGEELQLIAVDLNSYSIVIAAPFISVNTALAYKLWDEKSGSLQRKQEKKLQELIKMPLENWKENIENDFEKVIFDEYNQLKIIKEKLYESGALYASLSGSGAVLYGIFEGDANLISLKHFFEKNNIIVALYYGKG